MRTVAALFLALVVLQYASAVSDEEKAMLLKLVNTCVEENKLPADELELFKKKNLPESPAAKCFVACLMDKMEMIKDGVVDQDVVDRIVEMLFAGKDDKIALAKEETRKCHAEVDEGKIADKCEKAFAIEKCYKKNVSLLE